MIIMKSGDGGIFDRKHRKEVIAVVATGFVAGAGGVLFTWLLRLFGMK
jgi:hypothetical protein